MVLKDKPDTYLSMFSGNELAKITQVRKPIFDMVSAITMAARETRLNDTSFLQIYPKFKAIWQLKNSLAATRFGSIEEKRVSRQLLIRLSDEVYTSLEKALNV